MGRTLNVSALLTSAFLMLTNPAVAQSSAQIQIMGVTCTNTPTGPEVEGVLKNISPQPLSSVQISEIFSDGSGKFVSTNTVFAQFDPILPGQSSPFDGFGSSNPATASVQITPAFYQAGTIPTSGNGQASCN
jgi:hypothetical protein